VPALATERRFAQRLRECLEEQRLLDGRYRLQRVPGGRVALPVLEEKLCQLCPPAEMPCELLRIQDPVPSRAARRCSPARRLREELRRLLGASWSGELERDVPRAWQRHGDLVLLSEDSFRAAAWESLGKGERGPECPGPLSCLPRPLPAPAPDWQSRLGEPGWQSCPALGEECGSLEVPAFSHCHLLPAGIGYFTLPFLVHAGAAFVHACEWNSHAVEALHRSLLLNGVRDRCHIHSGDSRQLQLRDVADRVNLGLIPSSEEGWPVACRVLKKDTGGVLHIHHNVETPPVPAPPAERGSAEAAGSAGEAQRPAEDGGEGTLGARLRPEWQRWAEATAARIRALLEGLHGRPWRSSVLHVEAVKSYAPHVHHLVLDLECRPVLP
ncbi:TYW2 protein, partial [Chloropsis hardwickii]|nr:TYW2 protein [Chloropsis hardwickii]